MDKFILAPLEVLTDARLSDPERKVLLALYSFRGRDTNIVYPSAEKIAQRCGFKDKTRISKLTSSLAKKGWLEKTRQGFTNRINYQMTCPELVSQTNLDAETNLDSEANPELVSQTLIELAPETNSNKENQEEDNNKSKSANKFTDDDIKLAKFMFSRIKSVLTKAKEPNFEKWANDIRLMRERDGHSHKEIQNVFLWANKDSFWQTNIASPAKLRDKFDTLHAKANIQPKDIDEVAHRPAAPLRVPEPTRQLSDKERAETLAKIAKIKEGIDND
jgi:predicted transcriptional regulator